MDVRKLLLVCTITQVLSACVISQPKDVAQAKIFIESGRVSEGEILLTELASLGYYDAKSALAVHLAGKEDLASLKRAETLFRSLAPLDDRESRWYLRLLISLANKDRAGIHEVHSKLQAAVIDSPDMLIDLVRFEYCYRDELGITEQALVDKYINQVEGGSYDYLRLIDIVENPAPYMADVERYCGSVSEPNALNYCWRLRAKHVLLNDPGALSAFNQSFIAAAQRGEVNEANTVSIIRQMLSSSYGEPRIAEGYDVAEKLGVMGPELWLRIANYEIKDRYILEADELVSKLTALSEQGYQEADLLLAKFYIYGNRTAEDPWQAETYLRKAAALPEAKYHLGIILLSGELGYTRAQEGKDLLLAAGREGYSRAYSELMDVFSGFPGIQENKVYAHTFASITQLLGISLRNRQVTYLNEAPLTTAETAERKRLVVEELSELGMSEDFVTAQLASMDMQGNKG